MKIRFTTDYQGRLTRERFYPAGSISADLPDPVALIAEGVAVEVPEPKLAPQSKPTPKKVESTPKKAEPTS